MSVLPPNSSGASLVRERSAPKSRTDTMRRFLSLGAGVQSTTLLLMACDGEFGDEIPEAAIFADTGWEPQAVYDHLEWLESVSTIPIHRTGNGNLRDRVLAGERGSFLPLYVTLSAGDREGMLRRSCTREYKVDPITQELRRLLGIQKGHRAMVRVEMWQGISLDEAMRMRDNPRPWIQNRYPLVDWGMTRHACKAWLMGHGFPVPPKSACIGCPYHDNTYWRDMKRTREEEWREAVRFDRAIRRSLKDSTQEAYLHRSLQPLDEVDLRSQEDMGQLNMFVNECEGMCGV